ncbi:MAG TPA: LPS export ABC transporter periplasmic protein LptC [Nevskiaceae bacterium]|nr:LPS export ABC transporter periplasmic protein LptC [Nevskiaceae bacterium]
MKLQVSTGSLMTLVLALLTAAALMLTLQNYQRAARGAAPTPESTETPRYILRSAQWTRLDAQGQPDYVADADLIEYFDDHSARLTQPVVHAFGGGNSPWRAAAPTGSTLPHSRSLALTGGVEVLGHWPDGEDVTIHTEHLWIDQAQKVLRTDAEVTVDSASRQLQARGMSADASGKRVQLLGQVRGVYAPRS